MLWGGGHKPPGAFCTTKKVLYKQSGTGKYLQEGRSANITGKKAKEKKKRLGKRVLATTNKLWRIGSLSPKSKSEPSPNSSQTHHPRKTPKQDLEKKVGPWDRQGVGFRRGGSLNFTTSHQQSHFSIVHSVFFSRAIDVQPTIDGERENDRVGVAGVPEGGLESEAFGREVSCSQPPPRPSPQYFSIKPAVSVESQHPRKHLPTADFAKRRVN